jgi:hypothetical protein
MALSRVQEHILFTLGRWHADAQRKLPEALEPALTKKAFIDALLAADIAGKKERALYRNLEALESRRLVSYGNRTLRLTPAGSRAYESIARRLTPFLNVITALSRKDPLQYGRRLQTSFRHV